MHGECQQRYSKQRIKALESCHNRQDSISTSSFDPGSNNGVISLSLCGGVDFDIAMPYSDKEKKRQRQLQRRAEAIEKRTFCCKDCSYPFGDKFYLAKHERSCAKRRLDAMSAPQTAAAPSPIVLAQAVGEDSVPAAAAAEEVLMKEGVDGQQQQLLASEPGRSGR